MKTPLRAGGRPLLETGAQSWGGLADGRAWSAPGAALLGGVSCLELVNTRSAEEPGAPPSCPAKQRGSDAAVPVPAASRLPRREAAVFSTAV